MNPYDSGYPYGTPNSGVGSPYGAPSVTPPGAPRPAAPSPFKAFPVPGASSSAPSSTPASLPNPNGPRSVAPEYTPKAPVISQGSMSQYPLGPATSVLASQQTSLGGDEGGRRFQQSGSAALPPKDKRPLIFAGIAGLVIIIIILIVIIAAPSSYKVTVINTAVTPGLESFSVTGGGREVVSGSKLREGTLIKIEWLAEDGYKGVLYLNGSKTEFDSGYYFTLMEDVMLEVKAVERGPEVLPDPTHWSDFRIAKNSKFYKRYYVNDVLQHQLTGVFEIVEPADWGAVAYVTNQGPLDVPFKQSFSGMTLELKGDMEMSEYLWTPIADFAGSINGNGFTISGLKIDPNQDVRPKFDSFGPSGELLLNQNKNAAFISSVHSTVKIRDLALRGDIKTSSLSTITGQQIRGMKTHSATQYSHHSSVPEGLRGQLTGANLLISTEVDNALNPTQIMNQYIESTFTATVRRAYNAAGFVAEISSDEARLSFLNCANYVTISSLAGQAVLDTSDAYGFLASSRAARMTERRLPEMSNLMFPSIAYSTANAGVYFDRCVNYANFSMQVPNYGAAGLAPVATGVYNSANHGDITVRSGNIGGLIVGSNARNFSIRYSYNRGNLRISEGLAGSMIGGLAVGHTLPSAGSCIYVHDSANYGTLDSRSTSATLVGGLIAQFFSDTTTGKMIIRNSINLGAFDVVDDGTSSSSFFGGIVARIRGKGQSNIEVVFSKMLGSGAAIVDGIDFIKTSDNKESFENTRIVGALHYGPVQMTRAYYYDNRIPFGNFQNCGQVADQAGTINWAGTDNSSTYTLASLPVATMLSPGVGGVMGVLKGLYLQSIANTLNWYSRSDLGNWGMCLEMAKASVAKFDFNDGWLTPEELPALGNSAFTRDLFAPAGVTGWVFVGYLYENGEGKMLFVPKGESVTKVVAIADTVFYEVWEER